VPRPTACFCRSARGGFSEVWEAGDCLKASGLPQGHGHPWRQRRGRQTSALHRRPCANSATRTWSARQVLVHSRATSFRPLNWPRQLADLLDGSKSSERAPDPPESCAHLLQAADRPRFRHRRQHLHDGRHVGLPALHVKPGNLYCSSLKSEAGRLRLGGRDDQAFTPRRAAGDAGRRRTGSGVGFQDSQRPLGVPLLAAVTYFSCAAAGCPLPEPPRSVTPITPPEPDLACCRRRGADPSPSPGAPPLPLALVRHMVLRLGPTVFRVAGWTNPGLMPRGVNQGFD